MRTTSSLLVVAILAVAPMAFGEEETVSVSLKDGSTLVGRIVQEDDAQITVVTAGGLRVALDRSTVASIQRVPLPGRLRLDPNYSRLMFAPTGRPLEKGDGYFSDHDIFFPGFAYGLTDHFSLAGGVSIVPGLGLSEQVFYVAPRLGWEASDRLAFSTGALYATAGEEGSAAIVFGVATVGSPARSFTVGLGLAGATDRGDHGWEFRDAPIVMVGGNVRLSNSLALVSENWLFLGSGFRLAQQPFGAALRFYGDRLSADVGLIFVGEVLDEGFPIPWLSISYHFGGGRSHRR